MRTLVSSLALLCVSLPCYAMEFARCPQLPGTFSAVVPFGDERVSAIISDVRTKMRLGDHKIAICRSKEFNPGIVAISGDLREFALMLPANIVYTSDAVLRGIAAHELGHVRHIDALLSHHLEQRIDAEAAQLFGISTMIVALRYVLNNIGRMPRWIRDAGAIALSDRIHALEFGPVTEVPATRRWQCRSVICRT